MKLVIKMGIIGNVLDNYKFSDTVFLKESSELKEKYDALVKLSKEFPNNSDLQEELFIVKKGLDGEEEIKYQLSKSNIGMFVLHDIRLQYEDLKAQIDYVVVTKYACYFIECKNLVGNITVNEKGDFIREYQIADRKIKKGMYSPLRQVESQRSVFKKIWLAGKESNAIIRGIRKLTSDEFFNNTYKVLVVAANNETILDTKYAPFDIKYKVLKADALIRQMQYDLDHSNKQDWGTRKETEEWANSILRQNIETNVDYYEYYKLLLRLNNMIDSKQQDQRLRDRLIEFRKERAQEMNIPAYYVYTNDELEMLVSLKPKTLEKLIDFNILTPIKIKTHGVKIIEEIKNFLDS